MPLPAEPKEVTTGTKRAALMAAVAGLTGRDIDRLYRSAFFVQTQDNRITAHPVFQLRAKVYTAVPFREMEHEEKQAIWYDPETCEFHSEKPRFPAEKHARVPLIDEKILHQALTLDALNVHLRLNGHNLRGSMFQGDPFTYVDAATRCPETQALRQFLLRVWIPEARETTEKPEEGKEDAG